MSEAPWTPGPWHVGSYCPERCSYWIGGSNEHGAAILPYLAMTLNFHEPERGANANLIAAAPDMAEALRKGLYALASELYGRSVADRLVTSLVWPNDAPECVNIVCEDMRAALSKAQGETP